MNEYNLRESVFTTNLVNENTHHVAFAALQGPKRSSEVELSIVLLPLHTDTQENSTLMTMITDLKVQPRVVRQEIAVLCGVQADKTATNYVVLAYQRTISYTAHEPERFVDRDVKSLLPYS